MTKKPLSPKHAKTPASKNIERLAQDDYVDPATKADYSDSDIFASQGITIKESDNETREAGAQRTLARAEQEELLFRKERLAKLPKETLLEHASRLNIPNRSSMGRQELINVLAEAS